MFWPCETRTSTCRNLATISSGLYRFLAITVLLDVKDIPQVGPLQWGRSTKSVLTVEGQHACKLIGDWWELGIPTSLRRRAYGGVAPGREEHRKLRLSPAILHRRWGQGRLAAYW